MMLNPIRWLGLPLLLSGLMASACNPTEAPTTEMVCPHSEGTHATLDAKLQEVVRQYQTCELTEEQAAAEALDHHDNMVLIEVNGTSGMAETFTWMGNQNIRPRHHDERGQRIYAFVRVSLLPALAQRPGVTEVSEPKNTEARGHKVEFPAPEDSLIMRDPATALSRAATADGPELPPWLSGYRHPRWYPQTLQGGLLTQAASQYERGTFDQKMRQDKELACLFQDDTNNMLVVVVIVDEGNNKATMLQWLRANALHRMKGGPASLIEFTASDGDIRSTTVFLPVSKIVELSLMPELAYAYSDRCNAEDTSYIFPAAPGRQDDSGDPNVGTRTEVGTKRGRTPTLVFYPFR